MHSVLSFSHLKFRHLLLLMHLVEHGNLHKAAKFLNISQPAVSAMLREFERQVGLTLFERNNQGVVPTKAALVLSTRARTVLNEFEALTQEIKQLNKNQAPFLRVGMIPQVLFAHLPRVIERFREECDVSVSIQEGTAKNLLGLLFEGRVDCVIGRLSGAALSATQDVSELVFYPLYSEPICIIEGACAGPQSALNYESLVKRDWVLTQPTSSIRLQLVDFFSKKGLLLPAPVIETANYLQSLHVVANSNLCSAVPQSAVEMHVKLGNIRIIDRPADLTPLPVSFISRVSAADNANIIRFRDVFMEVTGALEQGVSANA